MGYYDESGNWVEGEGEGEGEYGTEAAFDAPGQTHWDSTEEGMEHEYEALSADGGVVEFEFVEGPSLQGEAVQYSYQTKGKVTAKAGSVVASIALTKSGNIIGTSTSKLKQDLGPNDIGVSNTALYKAEDGEYEVIITISGVAKHFKYNVSGGTITAA